ncbi:hypothetical protein R3W88_001343 [Solanum pinnatisectum]|uniref:Uncharacterized protein n=1 Tax=Solanum pinnatisectum TaxID=50273 RepID=A0AAV9MI90_9SOLN|nr:hypothetical protein R3W88_001343 [Solanum pinnatisectum]
MASMMPTKCRGSLVGPNKKFSFSYREKKWLKTGSIKPEPEVWNWVQYSQVFDILDHGNGNEEGLDLASASEVLFDSGKSVVVLGDDGLFSDVPQMNEDAIPMLTSVETHQPLSQRNDSNDEKARNVKHHLVKALERNGKMVSSHLEAQNMHFEQDREQRKDHVDNLVVVLNKLAGALGRIVDKYHKSIHKFHVLNLSFGNGVNLVTQITIAGLYGGESEGRVGLGSSGISGFGIVGTFSFGSSETFGFGNSGILGFGIVGTSGFGSSGTFGFGSSGISGFGTLGSSGFGKVGTSGFFIAGGTSVFGTAGISDFFKGGNSSFGKVGISGFGTAGISGFGMVGSSGIGTVGISGFDKAGTLGSSGLGISGRGVSRRCRAVAPVMLP